jgi:hypothetical protein
MFSAWASAMPPAALGGTAGAIRVYASADRIPSDFYVRDWNASPQFDNGQQPSTKPVFWATSDVWNQSTNVPAAPGPDGSVLGDAPSRSGTNFAYARVSRRAAAASTAPNATVTVNFFLADYGSGVPFASIGSETVTFTRDLTVVSGSSVAGARGTSNHLTAADRGPHGDAFALPSIAERPPAPPWSRQQQTQRNLQEVIGRPPGTSRSHPELERMRRPIRRRSRYRRVRLREADAMAADVHVAREASSNW